MYIIRQWKCFLTLHVCQLVLWELPKPKYEHFITPNMGTLTFIILWKTKGVMHQNKIGPIESKSIIWKCGWTSPLTTKKTPSKLLKCDFNHHLSHSVMSFLTYIRISAALSHMMDVSHWCSAVKSQFLSTSETACPLCDATGHLFTKLRLSKEDKSVRHKT